MKKIILSFLFLLFFYIDFFADNLKKEFIIYCRNGDKSHFVGLKYEEKIDKYLGPSDFYIDIQNNIYIADTLNNRIKKYNKIGGLLNIYDIAPEINNDMIRLVCAEPYFNMHILMESGYIYTYNINKKEISFKFKIQETNIKSIIDFDLDEFNNLKLFCNGTKPYEITYNKEGKKLSAYINNNIIYRVYNSEMDNHSYNRLPLYANKEKNSLICGNYNKVPNYITKYNKEGEFIEDIWIGEDISKLTIAPDGTIYSMLINKDKDFYIYKYEKAK